MNQTFVSSPDQLHQSGETTTRSFVRDAEIWPRILTQVWGSHTSVKDLCGQIHTFLDHRAACDAKKPFFRRAQLERAGCHEMFLLEENKNKKRTKLKQLIQDFPFVSSPLDFEKSMLIHFKEWVSSYGFSFE